MANASWMNDMSSQIGTLPLRSVVMPGTHDSGSYGITATSAFSADVTKYPWLSYLLNLHLASWIVGPIAAGWAKAQDIAVGSQLAAGIRYLDLRLNPYISVGDLYIVHSKYSVPVTQVLSDVSTFLQQNPNEIVILDFNHLYDMGDSDHAKMMGYLESYLGPFLLPNTFTPQSTLNSIWAQSGRVIVMYDDKTQVQQSSYLWSQDRISSPWPNTTDSAELFEKLDSTLATAPPDKLFVLQGVLTPDGSTVAAGMVGSPSSLQQMAQTVTPQVISWLRQQVGRGVNIVIADWFEYAGPDVYVNLLRDLQPRPTSTIVVQGTMTSEGTTCQALRSLGTNELFTLIGRRGFPGAKVLVKGVVQTTSSCMQGTAILPQSITPLGSQLEEMPEPTPS